MRVEKTPAQYLRECRQADKKSARALSILIDKDESFISIVERRGIVPPFSVLLDIAKHVPGFQPLEMCRLGIEAEKSEHPTPVRAAS